MIPKAQRTALIALAAFALLALPGCSAEAGAGDITQEELLARIDDGSAPLVLDVRTPAEYAAGHVPGAVNIPHGDVAARIAEIEAHRGDEVVVYCKSGRRAGMASEALESAGFTGVRHLTGDMDGWLAAGLRTE